MRRITIDKLEIETSNFNFDISRIKSQDKEILKYFINFVRIIIKFFQYQKFKITKVIKIRNIEIKFQ